MKKIKWLSAFTYFIPADYEAWFEDLASKGWHPKKIGQSSSLAMVFEKGEPKQYKYVVDLQAKQRKDYKTLYKDFGWEYLGRMSNIFIWRKEYEGEKPQSFTDRDSLERRSKRFVYAISFAFILFILTALVFVTLTALHLLGVTSPMEAVDFWVDRVLPIVLSGIFAWYLGYVISKIKKNKAR